MKTIRDSRLTDLLSRLSKKEINELSVFIASPFFNTNTSIIRFFEVLKKAYPFKKELSLQKAVLYKKTFGKLAYNDQRLRDVMSLTLNLAEKFIAANQVFNTNSYQNFLLAAAYKQESVSSYFEKEIIKKLGTACSGKTFCNNISDLYLLQCANELVTVDLRSKNSNDVLCIEQAAQKSQALQLIFSIHDYLNLSGINQFLQFSGSITEKLAASINFQLEHFSFSEPKELFWKHLFLFRYFRKFEDLDYIKEFIRNGDYLEFSSSDFAIIHGSLMNTLLKFTETNYNHRARTELAYLNKKFSQDGKFFYKNLNPVIYSGVVATNIFVDDVEWLEEFILSHAPCLPLAVRESTESYNLAHLYFIKKKYKQAIQFLTRTEYDDEFRQIAVYNLLLKIYFEKGDQPGIDNLADTYRRFLKRARLINEKRKMNHRNFIRYALFLFDVKSRGAVREINKFKEELQAEDKIVDKNWLLEKTIF